MKKCKRISTTISSRWLSFFAVTVLALAMIMPTAAMSATPVDLGTAGDYVILAKSGISTTAGSDVTGDLGTSASAATYITGFDLVMDASGEWSTSSLVTGKVYAADYDPPTPSNLTTAVSNMETAYTDANGRAVDFNNLHAGDISGQTLAPGVYKYTTNLLINSPGVTLDAAGDAAAVWIFQVDQNITMASDISVTLTNGAQAGNIFWALAGEMEIGTNSHFEGIVLSYTAIHFLTDASFTGRALAQTAVTLQSNIITQPDMAATGILGEGNIVKDFTIGIAYPNPFNPVCIIPLNLATSANVNATLYDINGRRVNELHNGALMAGSHDLKISGADLSTGIYFVHINVNNVVNVRKIALMK